MSEAVSLAMLVGAASGALDLVGMVLFEAAPPEVIAVALRGDGKGATSLGDTASGYHHMAGQLDFAASDAMATVRDMAEHWDSLAGSEMQARLLDHANWLQQQSMAARKLAGIATSAAVLYSAAVAMAPKPEEVAANRAAAAGFSAAAPTSAGAAAALAITELHYSILQARATVAMNSYMAGAVGLVGQLPALTPAPQIATPGAGPVPVSDLLAEGGPGTGGESYRFGSRSHYVPPSIGGPHDLNNSNTGPSSGHTPGGGGTGGQSGNQPAPGPNQPGSGSQTGQPPAEPGRPPVDPQPPAQQLPPGDQPAPPDLAPSIPSTGDPSFDRVFEGADQSGPLGTSPYSSTLAGLNAGGFGSSVGANMLRGGMGTMSGSGTGFRMPTNWRPAGSPTAFGAGTGNAGGPIARTAPRRGVTASKATMRRRRDKDEEKTSKIFVPGVVSEEIPVLERPPVIGVIEYDDADRGEESMPEPVLVGVIEHVEDEPVLDTTERPR
ncbi:PPE domain-containing protein [Nocardia panacis]|uniref:PPE domain-containing protein n=1 Tax=Nocardia panacis TaxID=2340916 RepID=A0A3A4L986_9NOCA|nr:PPE domain-containing protein [Nocardia panacis]RJO79842.1 PPE domain-containing protein [Nocardia panacis]